MNNSFAYSRDIRLQGNCCGQIPLSDIIAECDRHFNSGSIAAVGDILRHWKDQAQKLGDTAAELTLLSELMGHYRMSGDTVRGTAAVKEGFALIKRLDISNTASAGTILINGATALHSFGLYDAAMETFEQAYCCYNALLQPDDRKFAGLFNNMAAVYADKNEVELAEKYYLQALDILCSPDDLMDYAVTCVNLAQLYHRANPDDPAINVMLDAAMLAFDHPDAVRNGYYAHTCSKCAAAFGELGRVENKNELEKRSEIIYAGN